MPDYALYKLTLSVLTPLHIGSGRDLLKDYDFAVHGGQTWRINDAALLEAQDVDDPAIADRLAQTPPAQLLKDSDYTPGSPFFRYVIRGRPRSASEGAQVREQIKNINDQPYLPGSTLKGALRTVLGWYGWEKLGMKADVSALSSGDKELPPKFAAQNLERQIFVQNDARRGHEPNYDLLRAVQVSDSAPLGFDCLMLANASVLNRAGEFSSDIPVEMEALRPNTELEATLKLDLALFSDWAQKYGLRLNGEIWLKALPEICRLHARQRFLEELHWFQDMPSAARLATAYQQMGQARLAGNQFFLQLGWGTGWDDKTFSGRLRANKSFMETIIQRYHMARGKRKPGDPFPKSRRAAMSFVQSSQGQRREMPAAPLGWVLATLEPVRGNLNWMDLNQAPTSLLRPSATEVPTPTPPAQEQTAQPKPPVQRSVGSEGKALAIPQKKLLQEFKQTPALGDRFLGKVFDMEGFSILLLIPGLDDTVAYAVIPAEENTSRRKYKDGMQLGCEVISLDKKGKTWHVRCKLV